MNDIFMFKDRPQYPGSESSILGKEVTLILYLMSTSDIQVGLCNNIQGFYILIHDIHTNTGIFGEKVTQQKKGPIVCQIFVDTYTYTRLDRKQ